MLAVQSVGAVDPVLIRGVNQHREIGKGRRNSRGVNGEFLAVGPAIQERVIVGAFLLFNSNAVEGIRVDLVVVLGRNPVG